MAQARITRTLDMSYQEEINNDIKDLEHKWNDLSFKEKQQEFYKLSKGLAYLKTSSSATNKTYLTKDASLGRQNSEEHQYLNEYQNSFISFKAELGWESLKNELDFMDKKYFLCLPTLSRNDKNFIGRKITENNGVIKTSFADSDYIIVNEGVFNGEDKHRKQEQIEIFTHMNNAHTQEERINRHQDITKSISFIHESNYKSRIAKLVTHAPKKHLESIKASSESAPKNSKCPNVFNFLSNERWKILTLNDLYDIINRQESSKGNLDWFRKRLKPMIKEYGEFDYKSLFCAASFYRLTDVVNREMDHIVHYDQLDEAWVNKKLNSKEAEYLRQSSPLIDTFSSLRVSIPVINLNAPQGTAIFQTFEEYQHSTKSNVRTTLQEKYRKSIKQLTNKIGGMGKNCSEDHPEQKPSSKHSFCFLCKVGFQNYFEHVESESHKNSIYIHQRSYDQLDEMFDELYLDLQEKYPSFRCYGSKDATVANLSIIKKKTDELQVIDQQSTTSHQARGDDPTQKIEEFSLDQEGESNDQQINVIVEENSNDFTNRQANEELSPTGRNNCNREYSKFTPSKDVLNSKQIVSDLKSDCDFEDESKHVRAEIIGKTHEMNALMSKCSEEEKSEKEEKQEINHRATKLTSKISFGPSRMGSYEDIEMENMPFKNSLAQNTFDIKRSSLEEKCDSKKDSLKESPHFTESKSDKEKENKPENLHLYEREIFKNRVNKNERDARNSEKVAQSSSISNLSHTEKHRGSVEPRIHKPTYSEKDGKVLPVTAPRHQYNTSKPNGLSSQSQRSHISSRSHRGAKIVHPTSKRMAFGYNNPHLHQRLSKIRSKKKRDLKEYSKRADPILSDPNEIKKCISKGFKKIKQAKPVEMPRREYPKSQHISCSSKRQKLLLNR